MRRWLLLLAFAALGAGLLAACGGDNEEEADTTAPGETQEASSGKAEVAAYDFDFEPASLTGELGRPFDVTIRNEGDASHTFTIDELHVDQTVDPGKKATVRVTPSEPGELTFYCKFHVGRGMMGSLMVSGAGQPGGSDASPGPSGTPDAPSGYY